MELYSENYFPITNGTSPTSGFHPPRGDYGAILFCGAPVIKSGGATWGITEMLLNVSEWEIIKIIFGLMF